MDIPITDEGKSLFRHYCGIDRSILEKRALLIRQKALKVHHYRFIDSFRFLHPRIASNPFLGDAPLSEGKILDIGCGFGTDIRYLALRGVNPSALFGHDIRDEFVRLGFDLFNPIYGVGNTTENQLSFLIGNLDNDYGIVLRKTENAKFSWFDLQGQFKVIHAGSVLHLLTKKAGDILIRRIVDLLQSGGVFLGRTSGAEKPLFPQTGLRTIHSKKSLSETLVSAGFIDPMIVSEDSETIKKKEDSITYQTLHFMAKLPT